MAAKIVVVGSLNMDLNVRASHIPRPGETVLGGEFYQAPGGKGANQAVAAARLGAQVTMVGRTGSDAFGEQLRAALEVAGIDASYVAAHNTPNGMTGVAFIEIDESGQNSIVVAAGANERLTPADVERAAAEIAAADALLLQLEIPLPAVIRAAELAAGYGTRVILNPAPARALPSELWRLVDVLVPNQSETELLTGVGLDLQGESAGHASTAALRAAAALRDRLGRRSSGAQAEPKAVILTLGALGAALLWEGGEEMVPAFPVEPVDTTAAGDAFLGALAVALAEGREMPEAVRWGNAAGALATTKRGAQPSLPLRDAVEQLLMAARQAAEG